MSLCRPVIDDGLTAAVRPVITYTGRTVLDNRSALILRHLVKFDHNGIEIILICHRHPQDLRDALQCFLLSWRQAGTVDIDVSRQSENVAACTLVRFLLYVWHSLTARDGCYREDSRQPYFRDSRVTYLWHVRSLWPSAFHI